MVVVEAIVAVGGTVTDGPVGADVGATDGRVVGTGGSVVSAASVVGESGSGCFGLAPPCVGVRSSLSLSPDRGVAPCWSAPERRATTVVDAEVVVGRNVVVGPRWSSEHPWS